ncbi:Site-specific recombinase XerD [Mobiluncus mulieris]|nr:Site-specific recombinase XerD [Mobiluncus mulieris]
MLVHSPASLVKWYSNKSMNGHFAKAKRAVPDLDQRFTFHGLRHSGLTLAGQSGATLAELMHRAGHTNAETVMIYQHATQDRDAAIAEKMSAISN